MENTKKNDLWAVILAGGSGKRLWPLSRTSFPKQFINFQDSSSLLADSIKRASAIDNLQKILIVGGNSHLKLIEKTLDNFLDIDCSILIEPEARNTAPAIFAAAQYISSYQDNSIMLVMPSDHHYEEKDFCRTIESARKSMKKDSLVTLGIRPTSPEVGYGYIQYSNSDKVLKKVVLFKEKPDLQTAKDYISSNEFYWNSGIFMFDSNFIIQEFHEHLKESNGVDLEFKEQKGIIKIEKEAFSKLPDISIDYAILEKSKNTFTAEFLGKWSDLGSWNSLRELNNKSQDKNAIIGDKVYFEDSENNLVYSKSRTVGISGLNNIAVIDTPDALLITNLEERENSNKILDKIIKADKTIFDFNERVYRPWGWYESIESGDNFQVKRIQVYPNEQLSVQKHFHRSERWVVIKGEATVKVGDSTEVYKAGNMISIEKEEIHSLANFTDSAVEIIEVQLGSYLGEDDIVRYSDKYGRE